MKEIFEAYLLLCINNCVSFRLCFIKQKRKLLKFNLIIRFRSANNGNTSWLNDENYSYEEIFDKNEILVNKN